MKEPIFQISVSFCSFSYSRPAQSIKYIPGKYIFIKFFTYQQIQIFKIIFEDSFSKISKKSDPPHKIILFLFLNTVCLVIFSWQKSA